MSKYLQDFTDTDTLNVFYVAVEQAFDGVEADQLKDIKKYSNSTAYKADEIVFYNNKFYSCKVDFNSGLSFVAGDWSLLEVSAEQKVNTWDVSKSYLKGDYVLYNNRMYFALKNNVGSTPDGIISADWEIAEGQRQLFNYNANNFLAGEVYIKDADFRGFNFLTLTTTDQTIPTNRRILKNSLYAMVYNNITMQAEDITFQKDDIVLNLADNSVYKQKLTNFQKGHGNTIDFSNTTNWELINFVNLSNYYTKIEIQNLLKATLEKTDFSGFTYNNDIEVIYNSVARTITLNALNGKTLEAYYKGGEVGIFTGLTTWTSPAHLNVVANYFLYFGPNGIEFNTTPWSYNYVQIAYINFGATNKFALRETHGLVMDPQTHEEFHQTVGTYLTSGADLTGYTLNNTTPAERRPNVSQTEIKDEDIKTSLAQLTTEIYTQRYLTGAGIRTITPAQAEIVPILANRPYWNQFTGGNWVQTLMNNGEYQAIFLVAVPVSSDAESQAYRYLFIQGQTVSTTLSTIQALSPSSLIHGDGLSTEYVFVGKIIITYQGGNWRIVQVEKLTGTRLNQTAISGGNFLTIVNHGTTLTGSGTPTDPLDVSPEYVDNKITTHNNNLNAHLNATNIERLNKDGNGIFTETRIKRTDGTLLIKSVLSGGTSPAYTTRTEYIYDIDGTTILITNIYTLAYDLDNVLITETKN